MRKIEIMMVCMILAIIASVGVACAAENATADYSNADDSDNRLSLATDEENNNLSHIDSERLESADDEDILSTPAPAVSACVEGYENPEIATDEYDFLAKSDGNPDEILGNGTPISVDLGITVLANTTVCTVEDVIELTVTVSNDGSDDGGNVIAHIPLSEKLYQLEAVPDKGTFSGTDWNIATLNAGSSATLRITCRANEIGNITQTASVNFDGEDLNTSDNDASADISIQAQKSFMTISANATKSYAGKEIEITVTLYNRYGDPMNRTVDFYVNGEYNDSVPVFMPFSFTPRAAGTYDLKALYNSSDEYILGCENTTTLTVNRITPDISVEVEDLYYGNPKVADVELPGEATGNITLQIGDSDFTENLISGKARVILPSSLSAGSHPVTVTYDGDAMFSNASAFYNLTVIKVDSIVSVPDFEFDYNGHASKAVNMTGATGITASIDNDTAHVTVDEDIIRISGLDAGTYTLTVTTIPDSNHNAVTETASVTVNRIASEIAAYTSESEYIYGDTVYIAAVSQTDGAVSINTYMNGTLIDSRNGTIEGNGYSNSNITTNGSGICFFEIELYNLTAGQYTVIAQHQGDDNHLASSANTTFTVVKAESEVSVAADKAVYDYGETATLTIDAGSATGNVTIYVNDEMMATSTLTDGKAQHELNGLNAGNYTVNVNYNGDDNYLAGSADTSFTVAKIAPEITATADDITYGQTATVNADLPNDATGTLTLTVGNVNYTRYLGNETGSFEIDNLNAGTYNVNVNYEGNDKYLPAATSTTLKVNRAASTTQISSDKSTYEYGETATLTIDAGSATGNVAIYVNDEMVATSTLTDGKAQHELSDLIAGNYTVNANYNGDGNYLASSAQTAFTVTKISPTITATADDITYGQTATVNADLPNDATGTLTLTVAGKTYTRYLGNSTGNFEISGLTAGTYNVNVNYEGNDKYLPAATSTTLKVNRAASTTQISSDKDTYEYGETAALTINIGNATGTVSIYMDNKFLANVTAADGTAQYSIENLKAGNYTVNANYNGDDNYLASSAQTAFTVNKISPTITATADDITYGETAAVNVATPGDATGTLTLTVADKTYTGYLGNSTGNFEISGLNAGTYNVNVNYEGNDKYLPATTSTTLKVNRAASSTQISSDKSTYTYGETAALTINIGNATGTVSI